VACARWLIAFCVYDLNGFWFYVHGCVGRIIKPREFLAKLIKVFIHFEVFLCVSVLCFVFLYFFEVVLVASCLTRIFFTLAPNDTHSRHPLTHTHTAIQRDTELKSAP